MMKSVGSLALLVLLYGGWFFGLSVARKSKNAPGWAMIGAACGLGLWWYLWH